MSAWTIEAVARRLLDNSLALTGENVRERQEAIVKTWLETIERQERERCARLAEEIVIPDSGSATSREIARQIWELAQN